jgi:hypothetical protein
VLNRDDDAGSITVLLIGYAGIAVLLLVIGIDASKLFLAQRAMSAAADSAAVAAEQGVALQRIYSGGVRCGRPVPLNEDSARRAAEQSVNDQRDDLRHTFSSVGGPVVTVQSGAVGVQLSGIVTVPFGHAVGWLLPGHADGEFRVTETAHARSPIAGGGCQPVNP